MVECMAVCLGPQIRSLNMEWSGKRYFTEPVDLPSHTSTAGSDYMWRPFCFIIDRQYLCCACPPKPN